MTDIKDVRERIARAFARKRVLENIWRENAGHGDEAFIQRAVDHAWHDYLPDAAAALSTLTLSDHIAAVEAAGTHVVVPVEPTNEMLHEAAKALSPGRRPTPERVSVKQKHAIRYAAMLAVRPRDVR
jgi:hypothetical protein